MKLHLVWAIGSVENSCLSERYIFLLVRLSRASDAVINLSYDPQVLHWFVYMDPSNSKEQRNKVRIIPELWLFAAVMKNFDIIMLATLVAVMRHSLNPNASKSQQLSNIHDCEHFQKTTPLTRTSELYILYISNHFTYH